MFALVAQPVLFKSQLVDVQREAGATAVLRCETTRPGTDVVWRHGDVALAASSTHQLRRDGAVAELLIYRLRGEDSGEYSCDTGTHRTRAVLTVQGRMLLLCFDRDVVFSSSHASFPAFLLEWDLSDFLSLSPSPPLPHPDPLFLWSHFFQCVCVLKPFIAFPLPLLNITNLGVMKCTNLVPRGLP